METEDVNVKKMYTPYELFYDEGLSKTGWAGLLLPLYEEVEKWNKDKTEDEHKFIFSQIKEKFGMLCLYNFGATEEQWKRINMCEKASNRICMICGSPFKVGKTQGWITAMCEECAIKEDRIYHPKDKFFVFKHKKDDKKYPISIIARSYNEAIDILAEKQTKDYLPWQYSKKQIIKFVKNEGIPLNTKDYKLFDKGKAVDWQLQYDSVRITPIIKIALKLQKFGFYWNGKMNDIGYKIYKYKGYVKFFFYHNILKSDKLDDTIFNYKKY